MKLKSLILIILGLLVLGFAAFFFTKDKKVTHEEDLVEPPMQQEPSTHTFQRSTPSDIDAAMEEAFVQEEEEPIMDKTKIQQLLSSSDPYQRSGGLAQLALDPTEENIKSIEGHLQDPTPSVIITAAQILGEVSDETSVSSLTTAYQQNLIRPDGYQETIKSVIIDTLGKIKSPQAAPLLERELDERDSLFFQAHIVDALGEIGSTSSLPALQEYLKGLQDNPPPEDFASMRFAWKENIKKTQKAINKIQGN